MSRPLLPSSSKDGPKGLLRLSTAPDEVFAEARSPADVIRATWAEQERGDVLDLGVGVDRFHRTLTQHPRFGCRIMAVRLSLGGSWTGEAVPSRRAAMLRMHVTGPAASLPDLVVQIAGHVPPEWVEPKVDEAMNGSMMPLMAGMSGALVFGVIGQTEPETVEALRCTLALSHPAALSVMEGCSQVLG